MAGWSECHLHRVGFLSADSPGAFEFIDPFDIIHGIHMIPAFAHGKIGELEKLVACRPADNNEDWLYYLLQLQTIRAIVNSRRFKGSSSDEPRRVQVLDLYCLTRFESEGSRRGDVY